MTSEKQINANQQNAKKSTGPLDTSKTRYNAFKYGLTAESFFSKEDISTINKIYEDLSETLIPNTVLKQVVLKRISICVWRLDKSLNIEQVYFKNAKISHKNNKKTGLSKLCEQLSKEVGDEPQNPLIEGEKIDSYIEILMRYELTNENRLMKLIRFFKEL
jgi:hypothetical protein